MKRTQKPPLATTNNDPQNAGSFAAGFLVGVVTGAIGLWAAQDQRGKSFLQQIKNEFLETLQTEAESKLPEPVKQAAQTAGKKFPKFSVTKAKRS